MDGFQCLHISSSYTCIFDVINKLWSKKMQTGRPERPFPSKYLKPEM